MSELNEQKSLTRLHIYLTSNHSLLCRYCQAAAKSGQNGNGKIQEISLEVILQAIHEALPLGLHQVCLSGGEPLQYSRFDALLDQLESLEIQLSIETGGNGLSTSRAARLALLPQVRVSIGLDGADASTHDTHYAAPGAFEIATHAARQLSEAGLAPQIVFTITRHNYGQIPAIIRLAEILGAGSLTFLSARRGPAFKWVPGKNGRQTAGLHSEFLTVEELIALGRKIERELVATTRLQLTLDLPPAFRGLHPLARIEGQGRYPIHNSLGLLNSGNYALCSSAEEHPELALGRVGAAPLAEIWRANPTLVSLREGLPDRLEGTCGRCIMKSACLGYCPAENYLRCGQFWGANEFCATAERAGLFPAGRLIEDVW